MVIPLVSSDTGRYRQNTYMNVSDFIEKMVNENLNGDISKFDNIWDIMPEFYNSLADKINEQNDWLFLKKQTFDGWYLI